MKEKSKKIKLYISAHKKISIGILILILILGYWGYKKINNVNSNIQYVTATVEKGTIISSITASGQVEASNQVDIKSNVSGIITYVGAKPGDKVIKGKNLFYIDNKDALKAIRDAEISLESAKISLNKFKIQNSSENLNADLEKSYDDGFNTVSNTFLDLPGIMMGLDNIFFKSTASAGTGQWNVNWYEGQVVNEDSEKVKIYKENFLTSYEAALKAYNESSDAYKSVSRISDKPTIEALISQTYNTTKLISDTIKNANNYIDFVNDSLQKHNLDIPTIITTHRTNLNSYTSKTNTHLLNLLSIQTSIKNYKDAFINKDLDLQSTELSLKQKQNALQDAKDNLTDYYIKAPFNGTIANIYMNVGDMASGTLASIITNQKIATLSMNEVDVSKIKLGQKATITFDAVEDLSITGTVVEIDTVGTVSQGVVSYSVKIAFDVEDSRIKAGMSVSASIITDSKKDVLYIPSSAIKTQGDKKYVQTFSSSLPISENTNKEKSSKVLLNRVNIETGISDDINTEIISGLKEGDKIISRTITNSTATTKATSTPSLGGSTRGMGGGVFVR